MRRTYPLSLALTLTLFGFCTMSVALAQVPAQTDPGLLTPGAGGQIIEKQQEEQQKTIPAEEKPPEVKFDVPEQTPFVHIEVPKFQVNQIDVVGSTLFTAEELEPLVSGYEGKEVTLNDLQGIVERINQMYRDQGYLTAQAFVPAQEVDKGTVTIQVVEGAIGDLCLKGNKYYRASFIARNLNLESGDLFNLRTLEKDLNRINSQNNFRLKALLSPGDKTGETDIMVDVAERQPWQLFPTFDNQGRPFIGYYRVGAGLTNDSLLGYGDRLSARYLWAKGTDVALGSYTVPVGSHGDEISLSYGYSRVDVELNTPTPPNIIGRAHNWSLLWSHPYDPDRVWVADLGVNARHVVSFVDSVRDNLDEIRSIQAGLNFNKLDRLGRTFARVQATTGLKIFGGNAGFFKTEGFLTRLIRLPLDNVFIIRFYGQYTPDALPSAEAFQLGGAHSVRGFTEGLIVGDRGYSLTLEDRWPIPFLKQLNPWLNDRLQGAVFYDIGHSWLDKSNTSYVGGTSSGASRTLLMSAGFGLRAALTQYFEGFIDVGFGLVERSAIEPNADPTARIHFGMRSNLLSMAYKQRSDKVTCPKPKKPAQAPQASPAPQTEDPVTNIRQSLLSPLETEPQEAPEILPVGTERLPQGDHHVRFAQVDKPTGTMGVTALLKE